MMRSFLAVGLVVSIHISCIGQEENVSIRKSSHYLGIQANQLLRQLLSFGGSTAALNNPYSLIYSVNNKQTGIGFSSGLGYTFNQFNDGDPIVSRQTKLGNFSMRIGLEKKSMLTRHWMVSIGGDILFEKEKNNTTTISSGGGSSSTIITESKINRGGFGPRVTLGYVFSERIIVGTEASYYFKAGNEERTQTGISSPAPTPSNTKSLSLTLPGVIYLSVKF